MSSYGVETSKLKDAKKKVPPIQLQSFLDPRSPWVLVEDGSLLGFFDWVPKNLRVGPWSSFAMPTLAIIIMTLIYLKPSSDEYDTVVSFYPELYSKFWWYNSITFIYMLSLVSFACATRTKAILFTFTIISWNINMVRHGLNSLAPFLSDGHFALKLNHILRFPALVSATITFTVWNFVLMPYVCILYSHNKEKRNAFLRWNFSFRLSQIHLCNMLYSMINTIITGSREGSKLHLFDSEDLWYGLVLVVSYGFFYVTVLDRVGVHLYPIFSPRLKFISLIWALTMLLFYGVFRFWNYVMAHHDLEFDTLVQMILVITLLMGIVHRFFPNVTEKEN